MKTRSNVHICPTCQFRINTYGYPCSSLLELAIDHYMQNIPLTINDELFYDRVFKIPLQYLEKKGFLVSTEISDIHIQILPNMLKSNQSAPNPPNDGEGNERRFCWC